MNEIFDSKSPIPLINNNDTVKILISYNVLEDIKFEEIYEYQFR